MAREYVMIVEDDRDIAEMIAYNLKEAGYSVSITASGENALRSISDRKPGLILLDLMLPGMDGLEICRRLKRDEAAWNIPLIMVTAKGEDTDVVSGLEIGADDYITKPFSPKILVARVGAVLRRFERREKANQQTEIRQGDLDVNIGRHEVRCGGKIVDLSSSEFDILAFLVRNTGWVFSRDRIIAEVKGTDYHVTERSVDVLIFGLRKKLGACGTLIETVRGVGYRIRDNTE